MFLARSGLCGLNLRIQCFVIAGFELVASLFVAANALAMLIWPESFLSAEALQTFSQERRNAVLQQNNETAMEMLVSGAPSLIASALLVHGLRKRSSTLIYPWIIISLVELFLGVIMTVIRAAKGGFGPIRILAYSLLCCVVMFFVYSVTSYYSLLKREKRILRHVMQGSIGSPPSEMTDLSMESLPHTSVKDKISETA